jgi:phosphatidylserine/phosphatidylglycerophosphate/cardiolipin synthase-like enzyme
MARQTEKERELLMARKKIDYEELTTVEAQEDVDMIDVEMGEVQMVDADEAAAKELSRLSITEAAKKLEPRRILAARGPRRRGKFSNKAIASDQVHQRVRLHDPDRIMADDRRGGGGGYNNNNRKRRYNRGIQSQNSAFPTVELTCFVYRRR